MSSSSTILKPFAAVGLRVSAPLVAIVKDRYFQEMQNQIPYPKSMFYMAKDPHVGNPSNGCTTNTGLPTAEQIKQALPGGKGC